MPPFLCDRAHGALQRKLGLEAQAMTLPLEIRSVN